jgi:hypothetical protein
VIIALNLVGIAPKAAKYNPISLAGATLALLTGEQGEFAPAVIITAVAVVALLAASVGIFRKKRV